MAVPVLDSTGNSTAWNTDTTTKTASVSIDSGDIIVFCCMAEDQSATFGLPTNDGVPLTWTERQNAGVSQNTRVHVWTATGDSTRTLVITGTKALGAKHWGCAGKVFSGSDGIGATNKVEGDTTANFSVGLTTTQADSAVVMFWADWAAVSGTRTYLTTGVGTFTEHQLITTSANYTAGHGYYADVGTAAAKTCGVSAPTGQDWSAVVVEVKGSAGGATVLGAGTGAFGFTGAASGVPETFGTGVASLGFTGAASGVDRALGVAVASFGFTGAAAGIDRTLGAAVAAFGFAGSAAGTPKVLGVAAAAFGFTGSAQGITGAPPVTGTGVGALGFTATGSGTSRTLGVAAVSFGGSATATGRRRVVGSAAATFGAAFLAAGVGRVLGVAAAALGFTGTAAGTGPGVPDPNPLRVPFTEPARRVDHTAPGRHITDQEGRAA